jgi:hypothetical protein
VHGDIDVACEHAVIDLAHESAGARLSEGLVAKTVAARFDDHEFTFNAVRCE